jgi:hypothetical protein
MPRKKDPPLSAEEQKKRFEALARDIGSHPPKPEQLKRLIGRIASGKRASQPKSPK